MAWAADTSADAPEPRKPPEPPAEPSEPAETHDPAEPAPRTRAGAAPAEAGTKAPKPTAGAEPASADSAEPVPETPRRRRRRRSKSKPLEQEGDAANDAASSPSMDGWQRPPADAVPMAEGKMRFADLSLPDPIYRATCDLGFQYCTPIQNQSLPHVLEGKDLAGRAQTGTGKTAAFLIGAFTRMLDNPKPDREPGSVRMLALAPTRELAQQIYRDAESLGKFCGLRNRVVFGGMDHRKQRESLNVPIDLLVGTPGRIIDFSRGGHLKFGNTEILVIDEADRLLDMGFIPDVRQIVNKLPPAGKRQTLFFSATLERAIMRLVGSWLHQHVTVEIAPETLTAESVEQRFYSVSGDEKLAVIVNTLEHDDVTRMLVFGNRRDTCRRLHHQLERCGVTCALLSGDVDQRKRMRLLDDFRQGLYPVIIATDVAARGIHVDDISHVVNYDMPFEPDTYVHRIGRTGRAGNSGKAISLVCEYGGYALMDLESYLSEQLEVVAPPAELLVRPEMGPEQPHHKIRPDLSGGRPPRRGGGGRRGGRHGGRRRP